MVTLYFCYSTVAGLDAFEPTNSPYSLTWHVGRFLRDQAAALGYRFQYRNLDEPFADSIGDQDIVIGHTNYPDGWMNHALDSQAKAKLILQPYQRAMVGEGEIPWIKALFAKADHLLLVTGRYWYDTMVDTPFAEWQAKATRLDMAINPALHPPSKTRWNPPGKRRFLALGADNPTKGLDNVAVLARMGGFHLSYFGNAPQERFQHVPQVMHYGGVVFTPDVQAHVTQECDCFVSLANADANPTTLLETACWGLLPLCNVESGYWPDQPFPELRKDDMRFNLDRLEELQALPDYILRERAAHIREEVVTQHTWRRFCATVWHEVEKYL